MPESKLRDLLAKYKLPSEEYEQIYKRIKTIWTNGKTPSKEKVAVIIGGQSGAGKSGIISYSMKMFEDGNVIVINGDEIKKFHPKAEEIAKLYPKLYSKITEQEGAAWTSRLFEELRQEGYNIIFEGTMRNNRVADDAIADLRDKLGYTVIVRGLCACYLESRISILERYEKQVLLQGWGRMVAKAHHDITYEGMPKTIEYIEKNKRYDVIEIFLRGNMPEEPVLIYSACNPETEKRTQLVLGKRPYISMQNQKSKYSHALMAILEGRREDQDTRVLETYLERIKSIKQLLETRRKELIGKLKQTTDNFEGAKIKNMLRQLEEETIQILELLKEGKIKKVDSKMTRQSVDTFN